MKNTKTRILVATFYRIYILEKHFRNKVIFSFKLLFCICYHYKMPAFHLVKIYKQNEIKKYYEVLFARNRLSDERDKRECVFFLPECVSIFLRCRYENFRVQLFYSFSVCACFFCIIYIIIYYLIYTHLFTLLNTNIFVYVCIHYSCEECAYVFIM